MFDTLAAYLEHTVSPEQKTMCLDACQALVDAGIEDHEFVIQNQLDAEEALDADVLMIVVEGALKPIFENQIGEFGVVISHDASLTMMTDVFRGLNRIDNYDDQETINQLCDNPQGTQEALSDILELMGAYSSDEYLNVLDHVSVSLMERIESLTRQESVDILPDEAVTAQCRDNLRLLLESSKAQIYPTLMVIHAIEDGARLGMPLTTLVTPYLERLSEINVPERLALEVLGFALACDGGLALARQKAGEVFDLLHLDLLKITPASVALNSILKRVFNA